MITIRVLLEDLFNGEMTPRAGEQVYCNALSIVAEAGAPYIKEEEIKIGHFQCMSPGKPHLFYLTDGGQVHTRNCYIKREIYQKELL